MMQSKKYRGRTEIIYDILQTVRSEGNGAGRTEIMHNSFLPHYRDKENLTILADKGFHRYNSGIQKFRITEKGIKFLELCDQIDGFKEQHPQILSLQI
jgi:predicted transcriptional regulator